MYFEYFYLKSPVRRLGTLPDALPTPQVVRMPTLGGSSHRFNLATLPRWKETVDSLYRSWDAQDNGVIIEVQEGEHLDQTLVAPVIDGLQAVGHDTCSVGWWVPSDDVERDLRDLWEWKWRRVPGLGRPALQVATVTGTRPHIDVRMSVEVALHSWAAHALPHLVRLPLFSSAVLRAFGFPEVEDDQLPPRRVSDRISALERTGLISPLSRSHEFLGRYIEEVHGPRAWRRPPRVYVSWLNRFAVTVLKKARARTTG